MICRSVFSFSGEQSRNKHGVTKKENCVMDFRAEYEKWCDRV